MDNFHFFNHSSPQDTINQNDLIPLQKFQVTHIIKDSKDPISRIKKALIKINQY